MLRNFEFKLRYVVLELNYVKRFGIKLRYVVLKLNYIKWLWN